jgi:hypothetical protein
MAKSPKPSEQSPNLLSPDAKLLPLPSGREPSQGYSISSYASIKSKARVTTYAEVLTPPPIVAAMLDLVKAETERIESRFLEPACGTGNFLIEVLTRKLQVVEALYAQDQEAYERYAVLAVSSLYGIELLADNVEECRARLFTVFDSAYTRLFQDQTKPACCDAVRYIIRKNIIHGDALSLRTVGTSPKPIIFAEWSLVEGNLIKRRDFAFQELIAQRSMRELPLFSGLSEEALTPKPVRDYPPVPFWEIPYAYADEP